MRTPAAQAYAKRLARIVARRWAPTLIFVLLAFFLESNRSWSMGGSWSTGFTWDGYLLAIPACGAVAVGTMIAAALPWSGWRSALGTVVITSLCAGAAIWLNFRIRGEGFEVVGGGLVVSGAAMALRSFWTVLMYGLLFAAFCAAREREAEMLAAARNSELERASTQRALLESRLQVLQAQVDPALLFDGLADVHRLYMKDTAAAVTRLDELIAYLRSAMPKTRA